jgi:hypothetical protein
VNPPVPFRDRRHRSTDPGRASELARPLRGPGRLVGGIKSAASPTTKKPPRQNPGGGRETRWSRSGLDRIGALALRRLRGLDGQPLLLAQDREETANRMTLPAGRLHKFLQGSSAGPSQQAQDLGRFTTLAGCGALPHPTGLFARPRLVRRDTGRLCTRLRGKALDSRPNAGAGYPPARKLPDRLLAGQGISTKRRPGQFSAKRPSSTALPKHSTSGVLFASLAQAKAVMLL